MLNGEGSHRSFDGAVFFSGFSPSGLLWVSLLPWFVWGLVRACETSPGVFPGR